MKQPSPGARRSPAVTASLFLLPWPAVTICSINQSPGAFGAHTHSEACILQQLLAQLMPHMALHPSLPPPNARTIFLGGGHMAPRSLWIYRHICVYVATPLKRLRCEPGAHVHTPLRSCRRVRLKKCRCDVGRLCACVT